MLVEVSARQIILSTFEQDTPGASPHFLNTLIKSVSAESTREVLHMFLSICLIIDEIQSIMMWEHIQNDFQDNNHAQESDV